MQAYVADVMSCVVPVLDTAAGARVVCGRRWLWGLCWDGVQAVQAIMATGGLTV